MSEIAGAIQEGARDHMIITAVATVGPAGRAAFDEQGGRRHFQGCYVEREDVTNGIRVLERGI
jgi:hypothetical protein